MKIEKGSFVNTGTFASPAKATNQSNSKKVIKKGSFINTGTDEMLITSYDMNRDGLIGLKDLVKAKKTTNSSTGNVRTANESTLNSMKSYMATPSAEYNYGATNAIQRMEAGEMTQEEYDSTAAMLKKALNDSSITQEERAYYSKLSESLYGLFYQSELKKYKKSKEEAAVKLFSQNAQGTPVQERSAIARGDYETVLHPKLDPNSMFFDKEYSQLKKGVENAKKELNKAKEDWENSDKSVFSYLPKALNYIGGLTDSFDPYHTALKKAEKSYEEARAKLAEYEIGLEHGVSGEEYIEQLKAEKKKASSKEEKEKIAKQIESVRKSLYGNANWFEYIGNSFNEGFQSINSSVMSTTDFLVGKPLQVLGWENNPISKDAEYWKEQYETAAADTDRAGKAVGDDAGFIGDIGSVVTAAVPDLVFMYLTGGGSAVGKASQLGASAIAKANPTILNTAQRLVRETATSPIFYTSFIRELGPNYDEAIESGKANETQAALFALLASTINARIEMGGFQALPDELAGTKGAWNKLKKYLLSKMEEGFEELDQGVVTNALAKIFYDHDKAIISSTDPNAILNPSRQLREFSMGTIVGGLLGGVNLTFNAIITAKSNAKYKGIGQAASKVTNVGEIIDYCKSAYNDDIRTIAREVTAKTVTDADLGRLYQYAVQDITEKFDDVYTEKDFKTVVNEYFSNNVSESIRNIASSAFAHKLVEMNVDPEQNEEYNSFINSGDGENTGLQSSANGGIISNGGDENVISNQGAVSGSGEETVTVHTGENQKDTSKSQEVLRNDTGGAQSVRQKSIRHRTVKHKNGHVSYAEAHPDNSEGGRAYNALKNAGINAVYCDGEIELTKGDITALRTEAITASDGTVYVSSKATLPAKEIYDHERVHVADFTNNPIYTEYQAVLCDNIDYSSEIYICVADEINREQFTKEIIKDPKTGEIIEKIGKYDIEDMSTYPLFMREIAAYINQFVLSDPEFAEQKFGGMFKDWGAVVEAVNKFNTDMGADFSESASFMPENGLDEILDETDGQGDGLPRSARNDNGESLTKKSAVPLEGYPQRHRLTKAEQDYIKKICKRLGREVVFEYMDETAQKLGIYITEGIPDGYYDEDTGIIHIGFTVIDPVRFVLKHELTHFTEGTVQYNRFVSAVKKSKLFRQWLESKHPEIKDKGIDKLLAESMQKEIDKRKWDKEFGAEKAQAEVIGNFVGEVLFKDNGSGLKGLLSNIDYKERNIVSQYIRDFFNWLKEKLNGETDLSFKIRRLEYNFNRALSEAQATKNFPTDSGGKKFSFAGRNAKTANFANLDEAIRLEEVGKAKPEEIRNLTGWFRGYDGKWRFEIDDSKIEFNPEGDNRLRENSEYMRLVELSNNYNNLNENQKTELLELEKQFEDDIWNEEKILADYVYHPELFKAYPQLQFVNVLFDENLSPNEKGCYIPKSNTIVLRSKYSTDIKETLIHEIQHAIQHIEGFATGSSPKYWNNKNQTGAKTRTIADENKLKELRKQLFKIRDNEPEFFKEMFELLTNKPNAHRGKLDFETLTKIEEDPIEWQEFDKKRNSLEKEYGWQKVFDFMDLFEDIAKLENGSQLSSDELYRSTAGEIEAQDAAKRLNLTVEQRKNTRPDIDRQDVVFADGGVTYSASVDFEQQVDDVLNGTFDKTNHVYMGNTPQRLVNILGIQKLPMLVTNNHIYSMSVSKATAKAEGRYNKNSNYHDLGNMVKQLPALLNRPMMIIKSNTKSDDATFVVLTSATDKNGNPVIAAIKPNGKGKYYNFKLNSNVLLSSYGKDNLLNYVITARNEGRILYVNKSSQQTNGEGVQFPNSILSADYNNNLAHYKQIVNNYFMPESGKNTNIKLSVPTEKQNFVEEMNDLNQQLQNGEISAMEFKVQMDLLYEEAGEEHGTIKKGETVSGKENFDHPVPKSVDGRTKVRRHVRTVIEGGELTEGMLDITKEKVLKGEFSYEPTSNEKNLKSAKKIIDKGHAADRWNKIANGSGHISSKDVALGEMLLKGAIAQGDAVSVVKYTSELCELATRAGQTVQAFSLLKRLDGIGQLYYVQRAVNTLNNELMNKFKYRKEAPLIVIDETLAQQLATSKTAADFEITYNAILRNVAEQMPSTWVDKLNAWRYFAMLANPRTHIRNLVGNAVFMPSMGIRRYIAAGLEQIFVKEGKRTKAVFLKSEYRNFAENDIKTREAQNMLTGKGQLDERGMINDLRRTFDTEWLEKITKGNSTLLEAEDMLFKSHHYKVALASFLQARKADLSNVSESLLQQARAYAVNEAKKATYQDVSKLANYLNGINNPILRGLVEGILPFKRTPINIIKRGVEYSPIGFLTTVADGLIKVRKGEFTASEFIDGLAAGITGTGLMAIGMLLRSMGWVVGGFGDDEEDKFRQLNGEQEYSVQIFGISFTIDWAAPANIPFFIGVELMEELQEQDGIQFKDITESLWNSLEPMTNLSMLSGVQGVIDAIRYEDKSRTIVNFVSDVALSYAMQYVPSGIGALSRTIDPTQRTWYTDKNSQLDSVAQSAINNVKSKIPGLSYTMPAKIDAWGREVSRGNLGERLTENFVSPGYYSKVDYDEVSDELKKIFVKTGGKVFPKTADKSFSVDGKEKYLTADEYVKFAKAKGEMSFDYVKEFVDSRAYKKLDYDERAEVIENLYSFANAKAKAEVSKYDPSKISTYKSVVKYERSGGSAVNYYISKAISK